MSNPPSARRVSDAEARNIAAGQPYVDYEVDLALDLLDARAEAKTRCACVWAETHDGGEPVEECAPHAAMREAWEAHAKMDRSLSIAWGNKVLEADAELARLRGALEYIEGATRPVGAALYPSWLHRYARAALAPQKEEENPDAE